MGTYRSVSLALIKKWYILLKGIFVDNFPPIIRKNKYVIFLMKSFEMPWHFYPLSSSIFSILISKYNFSRILLSFSCLNTMILCNLGNKKDHIQYHNMIFSKLINRLFPLKWCIYMSIVEWFFNISIHYLWNKYSLSSC